MAGGFNPNAYIKGWPGYGGMFPGEPSPMYPQSIGIRPNQAWGNTWWSGAPGYASEPMPDRYRANPGISLRNPDPYIYTGR